MPADQPPLHPPLPPRSPPPLLRNEVIIEVDTVYAVHTGQPRRGRQKEWRAGGKEKTFHFLPSMRKNKKSDSYSNYPATRRDNSKREPSVEEVQCSSLGTKDSSPKQCCCLWPVMKTGWVVESLALGICGAYSNLLFCSTILIRTHWICDLVCPPPSDFYGWAEFKFKPLIGSAVRSSA